MKERMNWIFDWGKRLGPLKSAVYLVAIAAVVIGAVALAGGGSAAGEETLGAVSSVQRGALTISVVESGTIRPREQIVLKNELDDPATIVSIVPEGSQVKKGDLLVELDVTALENELLERRIRVQNGEANLIHAQENLKVVQNQSEADLDKAMLALDFAKQDLEKYIQGEYPKLIKEAEAKITLAEEELSQAKEQLKWSEILYKEKYLAQSELQQDELAAKKAQLNLELAQADLELLKTYTHPRRLAELNSNERQAILALERTRRMSAANLAQAEAALRAAEAEFEEDKARLKRIENLVARAKIYAPIDGMVLYASSVSDDWDDNDGRIEVGATVDERGEIIYLPTTAAYNVDLKISEVELSKVHPGLPVRVTVDAIPGLTLTGTVAHTSQLPDARSRWLNPNLKLYDTVVELTSGQAQLRNGMSCRVEIIVEEHPDALHVPIQSVRRSGGRSLVYVVHSDQTLETRPIKVGLDNNRFVHVLEGLAEGERILLNPPFVPEMEEKPEPFENVETADVSKETQAALALP